MVLASLLLVHGFASTAWRSHAHGSARAAVSMSTPIDAILEKVGIELPGPNIDGMPARGVVITGGAGGVGYAYADSFMQRGHQVVICDVSKSESVEQLGQFAKEKLGTVHYWINNAGINGGRRPFTSLSTATVEAVVNVNLVGVLLCTKVALELMQSQPGVESHVFNTVGSGVKGGGTPGYATYGATKRGLPQLTDSLVKELEKGVPGYEKKTPAGTVNVHTLSPGMVFTNLLLDDSTPELRKFPFGVLAAQPEEVGEDLVPKILSVSGNGQSVEFLTTDKVLVKFYEKFVEGKKSEFIDDDGNVIKTPGAQYEDNGTRKLY
jgi:chlorophyll(ide) b reductase